LETNSILFSIILSYLGSDESQDMFEKLFFDENKKTTSDTAP